jgi:hypothetical protein
VRQADQARTDFAAIEIELEVIQAQLARLPTRKELAQTALLATLTGAAPVLVGIEVLFWMMDDRDWWQLDGGEHYRELAAWLREIAGTCRLPDPQRELRAQRRAPRAPSPMTIGSSPSAGHNQIYIAASALRTDQPPAPFRHWRRRRIPACLLGWVRFTPVDHIPCTRPRAGDGPQPRFRGSSAGLGTVSSTPAISPPARWLVFPSLGQWCHTKLPSRWDRARPDGRTPCTRRSAGPEQWQRCRASSAGRAE